MVARLPFLVRRPFLCVLIPVDVAVGVLTLRPFVLFPRQRLQRTRTYLRTYATKEAGHNSLVRDRLNSAGPEKSQKYSAVTRAKCELP
jgi:hypothetical protein